MPREEKFFKGNIFSENSTNQREIEAEVERRRAEWKETHGGREPLAGVDLTPPSIPQIPLHDKYGRLLTNQREIEAEVERRRAEWKEWEEKGLVNQIKEEVCQTSDDGYLTISSRSIDSSDSGSFKGSVIEEKSLSELEEELVYLRSLPDEKGYLKKNIQDLESKIFELKQRQNFTQHHQIPPKK